MSSLVSHHANNIEAGSLVKIKIPTETVYLSEILRDNDYAYKEQIGLILRSASTSISLMNENINIVDCKYYIVLAESKTSKVYETQILEIIGENNV